MSLEMDKKLEARLKKARPAHPSDLIMGRIEQALKAQQRREHLNRIRQVLSWGGLAVAATVLLSFGVLLFSGRMDLVESRPVGANPDTEAVAAQRADPAEEAQEDVFRPVVAENNLKGRIDEGIVFLNNGLTARQYRYEFIDRVVWRNPSDGAVIEMEVPRDEVVLVPVQTF